MNKRQKLVQQEFLNQEEVVIKRLQNVYGQCLKDLNNNIENLQFNIDGLKLQYSWMDVDDPAKEQVKSMIQSKIYQKKYQEALQAQVNDILNTMQTKQFTTIADYLDGCYNDGFIGTVFDLHGQGIPLMMPINQESMVRAVQLDSKINKGLYTRLGEDVDMLKRKILGQVSRSIATGTSYADAAKHLANYTRIGYNNAIRITRTEGHRIQTTAAMDALENAKENGADVVKQWDAALDKRTRESHRHVDGEIRELDEAFSNGLMFPGDPDGGAAEVVNCRCALLQRAKWALDEDELETLKKRAEYFGLDKEKEFDRFKSKYLKATTATVDTAVATSVVNDVVVETAPISDLLETCKTTSDVSVVSTDYFRNKGSKIEHLDFGAVDIVAAKDMVLMLDKLDDQFESGLKTVKVKYMSASEGGKATPTMQSFQKFCATGDPSVLEFDMELNADAFTSPKVIQQELKEHHRADYGKVAQLAWVDEENAALASIVHEYGHTICPGKANEVYTDMTGNLNTKYTPFKRMYNMYMRDLQQKNREIMTIRDSYAGQENGLALGIEAAKDAQAAYDAECISRYSKESIGEFIAEAFCDAVLNSNPKKTSLKVYDTIKKLYGKEK